MDASIFVGMSKKRAQDVAESHYLIFRLISVNGESILSYPEDTRTDRICVEIVDSKVVKASIQ